MKNATLIEYLQARVKTLELDGRNLRANNATLSNARDIDTYYV